MLSKLSEKAKVISLLVFELLNVELGGKSGGLQSETIKITQPSPNVMLKFIIQDGWDDFTSVHSVVFN